MRRLPGTRRPEIGPAIGAALLLALASVTAPRETGACDPSCDLMTAVVVGAPVAAATTLIAPIAGLAMDGRPNLPYGRAVKWTALAAAAGVAGATLLVDEYSPTWRQVAAMAAAPVILGSVATYAVYRSWPGDRGRVSAVAPGAIAIAIGPKTGGAYVRIARRL